MAQNQELKSGQYFASACGKYFLLLRKNGNLAIYNDKSFEKNHQLWQTETHDKGHAPHHARLQQDGNFVLKDHKDTTLWSSNTFGKGHQPYKLVLQHDGNMVIYDHKE